MDIPLFRYSVFLSPAVADLAYCDMLIRGFSSKFDASPFEPHVTIYSGAFPGHEELQRAVTAALQGMGPFSLRVNEVSCTEQYFKTLFIQFEENDLLRGVHRRIREDISTDSGYEFIPHLSLLYHDLPLAEKQALARRVHLDREMILFDQVKIVTPLNYREGWRDTARWETVWRMKLVDPERGDS